MTARPLPVLDRGDGPPLLVFPGFGLGRTAYHDLVELLSLRTRTVLVDLFPGDRRWVAAELRDDIEATLDALGIDRASVLSHSFGTGLAVEVVARRPERFVELVVSDSVALDRPWALTCNAFAGADLLRLMSVPALADFAVTAALRPLDLVRAGWWGFASQRVTDIATIRRNETPCHVLWAERDTLLRRADGQDVARRLGASFHVVTDPGSGRALDHDWPFRHPHLVGPALRDVGSEIGRRFDPDPVEGLLVEG